jgi:predicted nucleotidyltransferase
MLNADFREIISAFNDAGVEYLVVGAYAVAAHGLPRATGDIDLWVRTSNENAARVWAALTEFGAPLDTLSPADFSTDDLIVQFGVVPNRIDILTSIEAVDFVTAWPDRISVEMDGISMNVVGREHLLQNKRAVGRPQDLADAARLSALERGR